MLKLGIALTAIAALFLTEIGCGDKFPTDNDIDDVLNKVKSQTSFEQRVQLLRALLDRLSNPSSISDDQNVKYSMDRLAQIYKETEDQAILVAIDNTEIHAGFANFVCGFYAAIKHEEGFKSRYFSEAASREPIERCVGISLSQEELEDLGRNIR